MRIQAGIMLLVAALSTAVAEGDIPVLLGIIANGNADNQILYTPGTIAGVNPEPSKVFINEMERIVCVYDINKSTIKFFDLETLALARMIAVPPLKGEVARIAAAQGYVFLNVDGMIHVFSYEGAVVGTYPGLSASSYLLPVFFARDRTFFISGTGDPKHFQAGTFSPVKLGEQPRYIGAILERQKATPDSISIFEQHSDYYRRELGFDDGTLVMYDYTKDEKRPGVFVLFPKEQFRRIPPFGYLQFYRSVVAGSGIMYFWSLDRKGLSVYRYVPAYLKGKAFMRLYNEKRMLELAKSGIPETISAADAVYIKGLFPEELRALMNAPLALNGSVFNDGDLASFFSTFAWYTPDAQVASSPDSLTPAQKRLWLYVKSVAEGK